MISSVQNKPGCTRRPFAKSTYAATLTAPVWLGLAGAPGQALGPSQADTGQGYFSHAFGVTDEDLQHIMARALEGKAGDYCDLYFQHSQGSWIVMEDGRVNRAYTNISLGMGVRVLRGDQTGYAFSQVLEMPAMLEAARAAASLASAGGQEPGGRGVEVRSPLLAKSPDYYPTRVPWEDVATAQRLSLLRRVGERLAGADKCIVKTLLQFHDSTARILLVNSEGVKRQDARPRTSIFASAVARQKSRRESNYFDITSRAGFEFYTPELLDNLADEAAARTLRLFEARPLPAGEMPCVLAAGSSGILLHEAIGHGLEADFNRRRVSTYSSRMGEKVASDQVSVVDDGTLPGAHGAINFDDEGTDSQYTVLVEKGVLKSFLQDRLSSRWYRVASTGSGRRQSFEHAPLPRMRATYMIKGKHDPGEIIKSVKKGLYAEQFSNGQVNIGAGDFSFYVKSGYAIEDGKLTHPVKDINVIGNGSEVLGRVSMVGDDLKLAQGGYMCGKQGQSVPVSQGLPTTLVSKINVGGTK